MGVGVVSYSTTEVLTTQARSSGTMTVTPQAPGEEVKNLTIPMSSRLTSNLSHWKKIGASPQVIQ